MRVDRRGCVKTTGGHAQVGPLVTDQEVDVKTRVEVVWFWDRNLKKTKHYQDRRKRNHRLQIAQIISCVSVYLHIDAWMLNESDSFIVHIVTQTCWKLNRKSNLTPQCKPRIMSCCDKSRNGCQICSLTWWRQERCRCRWGVVHHGPPSGCRLELRGPRWSRKQRRWFSQSWR